jgi:hypothetical protein
MADHGFGFSGRDGWPLKKTTSIHKVLRQGSHNGLEPALLAGKLLLCAQPVSSVQFLDN